MIDIETHKVVDMIDPRDTKKVTEWLKGYPDLETVSRDGSVSYRKAIEDADKNIIQVSDRFHLLKGLTDAAKKYIMQILAANIGIPVKGFHYKGTEGCGYWKKETADDLPTRIHDKNLKRKLQMVEQARKLYAKGYSISRIADGLQVSYNTAKKYAKEGYNPVNGDYNTKHPSKIKPYEKEIIQMLNKRMTFKKIEEVIRRKGYDGASSTIRMFATRERRLLKEAKKGQGHPVEKIERKWLISLLYKPIDKVSQISKEQLDAVVEKHPGIGEIYDIVKSFKEVLFSKKASESEGWLEEAERLEIDEITSFVNGTRQDKDAVKNAIELEYNNGLAEGSVNKVKTIKRIMYGRSNFSMLRSRILQRNYYR